MRTMVTIARALKEKNRVAGRLAKTRELVGAENSKDKSEGTGCYEPYYSRRCRHDDVMCSCIV